MDVEAAHTGNVFCSLFQCQICTRVELPLLRIKNEILFSVNQCSEYFLFLLDSPVATRKFRSRRQEMSNIKMMESAEKAEETIQALEEEERQMHETRDKERAKALDEVSISIFAVLSSRAE